MLLMDTVAMNSQNLENCNLLSITFVSDASSEFKDLNYTDLKLASIYILNISFRIKKTSKMLYSLH